MITEQQTKQRILKEKDVVMKDIEKMHKDLSQAIKEKEVVEKETKKMAESTRVSYLNRVTGGKTDQVEAIPIT